MIYKRVEDLGDEVMILNIKSKGGKGKGNFITKRKCYG